MNIWYDKNANKSRKEKEMRSRLRKIGALLVASTLLLSTISSSTVNAKPIRKEMYNFKVSEYELIESLKGQSKKELKTQGFSEKEIKEIKEFDSKKKLLELMKTKKQN